MTLESFMPVHQWICGKKCMKSSFHQRYLFLILLKQEFSALFDSWASPCDSAGKESTCNVGDLGSIPGLGRSPGEGKGYPLQEFWPGEFHGLYTSWGHKESDTTE